ncbi:DUF3221 domain-containing protein [Bacillus sp. ISL-35]|uniref:DUF3221 domain-containing protein n=1 Tax=Bacillus sp. ISL-35 TaxID=2819122 RepID=UPI001BE5AE82|nr:DUF3221 domain-containing protein [Bacillus sp. ISL-35]MBT2678531.1 DUF3221 domain-containing protein [Bacillus sp. ISL-35]MBT2705836.1 DUF3221 domain-containing protein [Chryseobacterium sp. ISL-80]
MRIIKRGMLSVLMLILGLAACSNDQVSGEGFILEVNDDSILVVQNINQERYKEIKDVPGDALIDQGGLELIWLVYDDTDKLKKGDHIEFWTDGSVRESYPEQATAKKIEHK